MIVAPNWLGDAVMALPAIADVRNKWRDAPLGISARASVAPLFALVDGVEVNAPLSKYDTAILLPNSFHSALVVSRAGVANRWGYRADWRGMLLTRAIDRPATPLHQIDYYQQLVRALGIDNGPSTPRIDLPPAIREKGAAILRQAGWDAKTPLVAIAPGAAYGSAKRWPPSAFADLAAGLAEDGVRAVMVGAAADRATAAEVVQELRGRATLIDVVGQTDIPALAGVLSNCRAVMANDSGALHLAAALGVTVTAAFGPTDERLSAPRRASRAPSPEPRVSILTHDTWCRPCALRECPLDHACMLGIAAEDARKTL